MTEGKGVETVTISRKIGIAATALVIALLPLWRPGSAPSRSSAGDSSSGSLDALARDWTNEPPEPVELTVELAVRPEEFRAFEALNEAYMSAMPGVTVRLTRVEGEPHEKWLKQAATGIAADLLLLDNDWVQRFASRGALQPVDLAELLDGRAANGPWSESVRWNGYDWAVPKDVDPYVWAYRPSEGKLTGKAGGAAETAVSDWLKLLQTDGGKSAGSLPLYFEPDDVHALPAYLWALGAAWTPIEPKRPDEQPDEDPANPERAAQLLELYLSGGAVGQAPETGTARAASAASGDWDAPAGGKGAESGNGAAGSGGGAPSASAAAAALDRGEVGALLMRYSDYRRTAGADWQWTVPDDGRGTALTGRSYAVTAASRYKEAAVDWVRFMTSPEAAMKLWQAEPKFPVGPIAYRPLSQGTEGDERRLPAIVAKGRMLPPHPELPDRIARLRTEMRRYLPRLGGEGREPDRPGAPPGARDWLDAAASAWSRDRTQIASGRGAADALRQAQAQTTG